LRVGSSLVDEGVEYYIFKVVILPISCEKFKKSHESIFININVIPPEINQELLQGG